MRSTSDHNPGLPRGCTAEDADTRQRERIAHNMQTRKNEQLVTVGASPLNSMFKFKALRKFLFPKLPLLSSKSELLSL